MIFWVWESQVRVVCNSLWFYKLSFKSLEQYDFLCFFFFVSDAHLGCIYLTKKKKNYNLQSLLQSSVSHDPSEIILNCWFIISVGKNCAAFNTFWDLWYFFQGSLINKKVKKNSVYSILFNTMCCILELVDLFNFCELFQTVIFSAFNLKYIIF